MYLFPQYANKGASSQKRLCSFAWAQTQLLVFRPDVNGCLRLSDMSWNVVTPCNSTLRNLCQNVSVSLQLSGSPLSLSLSLSQCLRHANGRVAPYSLLLPKREQQVTCVIWQSASSSLAPAFFGLPYLFHPFPMVLLSYYLMFLVSIQHQRWRSNGLVRPPIWGWVTPGLHQGPAVFNPDIQTCIYDPTRTHIASEGLKPYGQNFNLKSKWGH